MPLNEFKNKPVLKNPRFGWQRYQLDNASAAELKTSLWTANLSEITRLCDTGLQPLDEDKFPLLSGIDLTITFDNLGNFAYSSEKYYNQQLSQKQIGTVKSIIELVQYLNEYYPFLGKFTYESSAPGKPGEPIQYSVFLTFDRTFLQPIFDPSKIDPKIQLNVS